MSAEEELIVYRSSMRIPYRWAAGMTATRFYRELAEHQRLLGTRCEGCSRVLFPARQNCSRCFKATEDWVEVGPAGTITAFTVAHYQVAMLSPTDTPVIYALIRLDGADTAFIHRLKELDMDVLKIGLRVTAVFAEQKTGQILDISHFKPLL